MAVRLQISGRTLTVMGEKAWKNSLLGTFRRGVARAQVFHSVHPSISAQRGTGRTSQFRNTGTPQGVHATCTGLLRRACGTLSCYTRGRSGMLGYEVTVQLQSIWLAWGSGAGSFALVAVYVHVAYTSLMTQCEKRQAMYSQLMAGGARSADEVV